MRGFAYLYVVFCCHVFFKDVHRGQSYAQNLAPLVKEIGGTFCKYLAMKSQIPRNFHSECASPTCDWDNWQEALEKSKLQVASKATSSDSSNSTNSPSVVKQRVVLSYSHNGFGNQLWEHTVAFMVAESLKARLFIAIIPDHLCFDGATPPNTYAGMNAMERLLPPEFLYDSLPLNSSYRQLCDSEPFFLSDRPRDWRNNNYTGSFKANVHNIITDPNPRCIKMLGYFQNLPLCAEDARRLWTPRMVANFTVKPGENDISIYLRCLPRHYFFNDWTYYETILNHTTFDRVWLFQAPECPTKLGDNPSKDGVVAAVVRLLVTKYKATRWPTLPGSDDTAQLLYDLAGLAQSKKLILPVSSWAYWAGLLSNATEIHVNGPPHHPIMSSMPQYIYHLEKARKYFGRYNNVTNDIDYSMDIAKDPTLGHKKHPHPHHGHGQHGKGNATGAGAGGGHHAHGHKGARVGHGHKNGTTHKGGNRHGHAHPDSDQHSLTVPINGSIPLPYTNVSSSHAVNASVSVSSHVAVENVKSIGNVNNGTADSVKAAEEAAKIAKEKAEREAFEAARRAEELARYVRNRALKYKHVADVNAILDARVSATSKI